MVQILTLAALFTAGLTNQNANFADFDSWSSKEVKQAFAKPVFHDVFINGKPNRLARYPWNRAQSTIAWYMAVRGNEALNKTRSAVEADKVVRATINGWTFSLTYHQSLYLWHTIYQFDDYYNGDPFWSRIGKDAWLAKELGGLSVEANAKLPALGGIQHWVSELVTKPFPSGSDRIRYDDVKSGAFMGFDSDVKHDRATLGISVDDRGILRFQEDSLLAFAHTKKAPWSEPMQQSASDQLKELKKALSLSQQAELDKVIARFETELSEALDR